MKKILWLLGTLALVAGPAHAEKIAYLGVATMPVEPVAAYQLKLPEGVGLAVMEVAEDGVVKDKLVEHDILQKLDDQILTSPDQLAVLVRSYKPGDTVKLTALRKGKEEEPVRAEDYEELHADYSQHTFATLWAVVHEFDNE